MSNRRRPTLDPMALIRTRYETVLGADPKARQYPNHEASAWLRSRLALIPSAIPCPHLAAGIYPLPLSYVLWRPDRLDCVPCAGTYPPLTGDEERICDRCGTHADPIKPLSMLLGDGRVHVGAGLCDTCTRLEVGP